jgi:hypothetical protein
LFVLCLNAEKYTISRKVPHLIPDDVIAVFNRLNFFQPRYGLEATRPLLEISTRDLPGGKRRPARESDNLSAVIFRRLENVRASTIHSSTGPHGLL